MGGTESSKEGHHELLYLRNMGRPMACREHVLATMPRLRGNISYQYHVGVLCSPTTAKRLAQIIASMGMAELDEALESTPISEQAS